MLKELKYLFYLIVIFLFIFFTIRYYFSETNIKNTFNSINQIDKKLEESTKELFKLKNDTDNIIEFVEYKSNKETKKYSFWELLYND